MIATTDAGGKIKQEQDNSSLIGACTLLRGAADLQRVASDIVMQAALFCFPHS